MSFELAVAAFEVWLVLVGGEHLGRGLVLVVGDQREDAVDAGVVGDNVGAHGGVEREPFGGRLAVAGVGARAAAVLLAERVGGDRGDGGLDPALGVDTGEGAGGGFFDGDEGLVAAAGPCQAGRQFLDGGEAGFDASSAGGGVVDRLGRGVHPDDAEPAIGGDGRLEGAPDLGAIADATAGTAGRLGPVGGVVLDPVGESGHFAPVGGQDGDEPAAVGIDVGHRVGRGELAVGHVQEVGPAEQGDELVPGGQVGDVVVGVARLDPVGDRHRPVGGDGEDPHQLAQVGAVV